MKDTFHEKTSEVVDIILKDGSLDQIPIIYISSSILLECLSNFKSNPSLQLNLLVDLFAADFPDIEKRFEVAYHLLSITNNIRAILKVKVLEKETLPSVVSIFSSAGWYEREVFDMFGVEFDNNPDLRRILSDYGFVGHPLRKDFPLFGYTQVRYDEKLQKVIKEPVSLQQPYREFDFASPWEGTNYQLPGDEKETKE